MAPPRFLTSITLDATNNAVGVAIDGAGVSSATIAAGTYYLTDDDSASDLLDAIETAFDAVAGTWTLHVNGVGSSSTTYAWGRLAISESTNASGWELDFTVANGLDPRILGYAASYSSSGSVTHADTSVKYSDYVHRYGWYPARIASEQDLQDARRRHVEYTETGAIDDLQLGDYDVVRLGFQEVLAGLCSVYDASVAAIATAALLTAGDVNAPFEAWCLDCDGDNAWLYYPDQSVTATSWGPFRFAPGSNLWTNPLGPPTVLRPGKRRNIPIVGYEAPAASVGGSAAAGAAASSVLSVSTWSQRDTSLADGTLIYLEDTGAIYQLVSDATHQEYVRPAAYGIAWDEYLSGAVDISDGGYTGNFTETLGGSGTITSDGTDLILDGQPTAVNTHIAYATWTHGRTDGTWYLAWTWKVDVGAVHYQAGSITIDNGTVSLTVGHSLTEVIQVMSGSGTVLDARIDDTNFATSHYIEVYFPDTGGAWVWIDNAALPSYVTDLGDLSATALQRIWFGDGTSAGRAKMWVRTMAIGYAA